MVFAYHSSLTLLRYRRSLLFVIAVAEHWVYPLLSFFTSARNGGPVEYSYAFPDTSTLAESGVLPPLSQVIPAFVADVGLFSILQGSHFELKEAYLAYHCSRDVDWDDDASVGWFPYTHASGDAL